MSRLIPESELEPKKIFSTRVPLFRFFFLRLKISFRDWLLSTPQEFYGRKELEAMIREKDAEISILRKRIKKWEVRYSLRTKEIDDAIRDHLTNIANPSDESYPGKDRENRRRFREGWSRCDE
jgi:hypothetical protein